MPTQPINGVSWNVVDEGSGPTILFVHGFPLDHSMWAGQRELQAHFRLLMPDLPGFGRSQLASEQLSMARVADDLVVLLDQLGIDQPVAFCGLSMGGYIGWEMCQRHPKRLCCLIQCDTRAIADSPEVAKGRQMMAEEVVREGSHITATAIMPKLFSPTSMRERGEIVEQTRHVILNTDPNAIAAAQRGMSHRRDFMPLLAEIDLPTRLICGESDQISPPAEMRDISARMPRADYVEIPLAGHMAPLENPTAVNTAILQFLRTLSETA